MAIPDFQSLMLPLLEYMGDEQEHLSSEIGENLSDLFGLTDEERQNLLPSGRQTTMKNRVAWALSYLRQAALLENISRGRYRITRRGLELLHSRPQKINIAFLEQFPEFIEFRTRGRNLENGIITQNSEPIVTETKQTPEELLDISYQQLRDTLAQEILDRVKQCSPRFFETLVVDLLLAMGYGGSRRDAGQAIGRSGDGGIDGVINEDRLGLDTVYIQAKRWENVVGRPQIQAFAGSLDGERANKGVFITTSSFSADAQEYVRRIQKKIVLIDGKTLAQYMIDFGVGVNEVVHYVVKKIDNDYFSEE